MNSIYGSYAYIANKDFDIMKQDTSVVNTMKLRCHDKILLLNIKLEGE